LSIFHNAALLSIASLGILSKSTGQTLRIAACLNILIKLRDEAIQPWPAGITEGDVLPDAVKAASNFVDVYCIHAAYMAGRSTEPAESQNPEKFFCYFLEIC